MQVFKALPLAILVASTQIGFAQNTTPPQPCDPQTENCDPGRLPDEQVTLPPTGDVQNILFAILPAVGAAGLAALAAGGGGNPNTTTSTTD